VKCVVAVRLLAASKVRICKGWFVRFVTFLAVIRRERRTTCRSSRRAWPSPARSSRGTPSLTLLPFVLVLVLVLMPVLGGVGGAVAGVLNVVIVVVDGADVGVGVGVHSYSTGHSARLRLVT